MGREARKLTSEERKKMAQYTEKNKGTRRKILAQQFELLLLNPDT